MSDVEVTIDASRGAITVRGGESFVSATLDKYKSVFESAPKVAPTPASSASVKQAAVTPPNGAGAAEAYPNVFDIEGENVSILVTPPGNNLATQARGTILLFLYARYKMGAEPTGVDAIKEQCKTHACFDPKNFASHLKSQKSLVTVTGGNSAMAARLTVPGRKAAEELAGKLQNAE